MTAQLGVGQEPKGHAMQERESDFQQANSPVGPEDLDESWWSAVLADEPLLEGQLGQDFVPVEEEILNELGVILPQYAKERQEGEHFGDFVVRAGIIKATTDGTNFHD